MSDINYEETSLIEPAGEPDQPGKKSTWWIWALAAFLGFLLIASTGAYSGYRSGLQQRLDLEKNLVSQQVQEQFDLGVRDFNAGLYDLARQRFEYVIEIDPGFPGVTDYLAETLLAINVTATPTPVPTPTLTPTPDLRAAEDLFFQAERMISEENWTGALETLDALRKKEPEFKAIAIDGLYYIAYRNRGIFKIGNEGNLEGGMYDLARAEIFGPLDREADAWRSWARLYVSGARFWDVNWPQVITYFFELVQAAPNLRDSGGWTAVDRLRQAYARYGDLLSSQGDFCNAQIQYEAALQAGADLSIEPTATSAAENCAPPTPKPPPGQPQPGTPVPGDPGATPLPTELLPPATPTPSR
jgi:tetratricopeptide (TPR) repeat protein